MKKNSKIIGGIVSSLLGSIVTILVILFLPLIFAGYYTDFSLFLSIFQIILVIGTIITFIGIGVSVLNARIGKLLLFIGGFVSGFNIVIIIGASIIVVDMSKYNLGIVKQEDVKKYLYQAIGMVIFGFTLLYVCLIIPLYIDIPVPLYYFAFPTFFAIIVGSASISAYFNNPEYCLKLMSKKKWKQLVETHQKTT